MLLAGNQFVEAADIEIVKWEQKYFDELDTNKDGVLDKKELRDTARVWMTEAGYSEDKQIKETNKRFKRYDSNNDNKIIIEEFITVNRANDAASKAAKKTKSEAPTKIDPDSLLKIGDIAPNFLGTDKDGNKVNVDELKGKIVIASFWVSWCKQCKDGLGILENLQNKVGSEILKVVAIGSKQDSKRLFKKYKNQLSDFNLTLTHDSRGVISKNYGVKKAPHLFIIGKDGKIIFMDSNYNQTPVNGIIEALKKELTK
jgi:peroxiredoxin/Ca2+-binding EF-hand superfamily protein